jgi:4'-phosphopantetheinyl transferase EntD
MGGRHGISLDIPEPTVLRTLPALAAVFGPGVLAAVMRVAPEPPALHPSDRAHVAGAHPARRREFATGRALARRLLRRLGCGEPALPAGADGAPCWPPGVVGAISHAAGVCVVAVARQGEVLGLGVDLEPSLPLEPELGRFVCTAAEQARLADLPADLQRVGARLFFSAKEAVYKCGGPDLRLPVGPGAPSLALDPGAGTFAIAPAASVAGARLSGVLHGRFAVGPDWIVSGATLVWGEDPRQTP